MINSKELDQIIEKGQKVTVNKYMQAITKSLQQMFNVLTSVLEQTHMESVLKDAFNYLVGEMDTFFGKLNIDSSKFAKKRITVDLVSLQKALVGLKFEDETRRADVISVVDQKIKQLLASKCGQTTALSPAQPD